MTTLLADARKIQEDLTVIQTILLAAHKADMAADTWEQATSRAQAVTVNIAMRKCGKMSDGIRHKVLSELCGRDITSAYMLGKKVASELIEWLYGRDGDIKGAVKEDAVLIVKFLADQFQEVKVG